MSEVKTRERSVPLIGQTVVSNVVEHGDVSFKDTILASGKQITVSTGNPRNPRTGNYESGGPFYTSRATWFSNPGHVKDAYYRARDCFYSGPIMCKFPSSTDMANVGFSNPSLKYGDKNESSMMKDGTGAISYCSPTNPMSNLGTTLAETYREGLPSLPGIQSWKRRTEALKAAGSEYLNYIFGWAPLLHEVHEVRDAARGHKFIMENYEHGQGRNTHRTFHYPSTRTLQRFEAGSELPSFSGIHPSFFDTNVSPKRWISLVRENKRWFEGCFTYAVPSSTDSWRRALGFGTEADQLFGIALTPDILWELTPWSWAVDWFSNAGEVINNVTNFGLAGLVMRYGYMMEESIERVTAEVDSAKFFSTDRKTREQGLRTTSGSCSCGVEVVTKRRIPASPFGFSIGWEGLSPTQLAITAALGITRLL